MTRNLLTHPITRMEATSALVRLARAAKARGEYLDACILSGAANLGTIALDKEFEVAFETKNIGALEL